MTNLSDEGVTRGGWLISDSTHLLLIHHTTMHALVCFHQAMRKTECDMQLPLSEIVPAYYQALNYLVENQRIFIIAEIPNM